MTTSYKQIQLTNTSIGDVAAQAFIPLGTVTRRINTPSSCSNTFTLSSSTTDSVIINDVGFYKITYSLTATAAAAGEIVTSLVVNGTTVYSVSQGLVDEANPVSLTLPYTIRVYGNCTSSPDNPPVTVQLQNTGIALTGSTSNLIIEKI